MSDVIAVLCSDLHFSQTAPAARSDEPDWFAVQERAWNQIREQAERYDVPIVIAGDVFDNWRSSPQLINFVLRLFSGLEIYAVPGQHDLPNHRYDEVHRSAYGTLIAADSIIDIGQGIDSRIGIVFHGFAWGREVASWADRKKPGFDGRVHLAVVHAYCWKDSCHPGASEDDRVGRYADRLKGYDAAVFGDNHAGFMAKSGRCTVFNAGTMICRRQNERSYRPRCGLLRDNSEVECIYLNTEEDVWTEREEVEAGRADVSGLVAELESLGGDALDFEEVLLRRADAEDVPQQTKRLILEALDHARSGREQK
jgi:hypothetical protein